MNVQKPNFQPGERVRLKGTDQIMTVFGLEAYGALITRGYVVRCDWLGPNGEPWNEVYDPNQLEKA